MNKMPGEIYHLDTVDSTNDYIKRNIAVIPDGSVVWADEQTKGKGRLGREWKGPKGNLYASFVYQNPPGDVALYPLLSGLAVFRTIAALTGIQGKIKWPNDVLIGEKKTCGILCESIISSSQIYIICGIGINVNVGADAFSREALPYATSLGIETGKTYDLEKVLEELSRQMEQIRTEWGQHGFATLKQQYEKQLISLGKTVQVIYQRETLVGTCLGIAENGNLRCQLEDGREILVNSGEASVRGIYGYAL